MTERRRFLPETRALVPRKILPRGVLYGLNRYFSHRHDREMRFLPKTRVLVPCKILPGGYYTA